MCFFQIIHWNESYHDQWPYHFDTSTTRKHLSDSSFFFVLWSSLFPHHFADNIMSISIPSARVKSIYLCTTVGIQYLLHERYCGPLRKSFKNSVMSINVINRMHWNVQENIMLLIDKYLTCLPITQFFE